MQRSGKELVLSQNVSNRTYGNAGEAAGPYPHSSIMVFQDKAILRKPCDQDEEFGAGELAQAANE